MRLALGPWHDYCILPFFSIIVRERRHVKCTFYEKKIMEAFNPMDKAQTSKAVIVREM